MLASGDAVRRNMIASRRFACVAPRFQRKRVPLEMAGADDEEELSTQAADDDQYSEQTQDN